MALPELAAFTAEAFERWAEAPENTDRLLELIGGEVSEKMPTQKHGEVQLSFGGTLQQFARKHKLGRVGAEVRHRMPDDQRNSRLPVLSFIAGKHPTMTKGSIPRMPDLAVEIQSPDDTLDDLRAKAVYYLANGTRLVWLLLEDEAVLAITRFGETRLTGDDVLTGGDVLPGFSIVVKAIFADPLSDDEPESD